MIAALYVQTNGCYYGLEDVDPWDEARDARKYQGPYPVVAHPPCARWCRMAPWVESMGHGAVGDDGGTFFAAMRAVEQWGGVLEHPADSIAFAEHGLPIPIRNGWTQDFFQSGWTTEVSQSAYGHRARKRTWLYYVGDNPPPPLDWSDPPGEMPVQMMAGKGSERLATPKPFRDLLLSLARNAR